MLLSLSEVRRNSPSSLKSMERIELCREAGFPGAEVGGSRWKRCLTSVYLRGVQESVSYHTLAGRKIDITSVTFAVFGIPFETAVVLSRPFGAGESIAMGVDDIWAKDSSASPKYSSEYDYNLRRYVLALRDVPGVPFPSG